MRKKVEHPSFGNIVISRSSGRQETILYGSKQAYNSPVNIVITGSARYDDMGYSSYMGNGHVLVEIDMTEEQWAHACNRMNEGGGTPCTLRWLADQKFDNPPPEPSFGNLAVQDLEKTIEEVKARFTGLRAELSQILSKPKLTVADKKKLTDTVSLIDRVFSDSAPFLTDQFRRQLCSIVDAAQHAIIPFDGQAALEAQKP